MTEDLSWVPDQTYAMGSERHYPEDGPVHQVTVDGFWIETHQVTNAKFAEFVAATGYVTVAERPLDPADFPGAPAENLQPGSMVFTPTAGLVNLRHIHLWWTWPPGASWRHPEGIGSSIKSREDHPVVHVAYEDAETYANWSGRELPSEAEWEAAARGGLDQMIFIWGDHPEGASDQFANFWHGDFPWRPDSGYGATTPVASFPPTRTAFMTWREMFGTGLPTGTPTATRTRSTSPAASRVIHEAAQSRTASITGNPSSGCLAK